AAAVDRAGAGRQPGDRGAGRADHRARPERQARNVGPDRAGPRERRHRRAGHALHGRGGASVRPGRGDRRRAGGRDRHARRAGRIGERGAANPLPAAVADRRRPADRAARGPRRQPARAGGDRDRDRQPAPRRHVCPRPQPGRGRGAAHRAGQPGRRIRGADHDQRRPPMTGLSKLTWMELKLFVRQPLALFFGIVFPAVLAGLLGSLPAFRTPHAFGSLRVIDVYVPITITFLLAMLALSVAPTALTTYRERGVLRRLATTPVRPVALLAAQLLTCLLAAVVS